MMMALKNKNEAVTELAKQRQQLIQEKEQLEQTELARTAEAQRGQQAAAQDAEQQRVTYRAEVEKVNKNREDELSKFKEMLNKQTSELEARDSMLAKKAEELKQTESTVETQKKRIADLVDQPFEVPDGKVLWVNQRARLVWINLGSSDGLRRQTTFSVFDQDAMNIAPRRGVEEEQKAEEGGLARQVDNAKAKIEITSVQDNSAEGRIVDDLPGNPIMPGDVIFSPAWKPGRLVHFAFAGVMDIDGDRRSDRELLQSIITMNGGVLDEVPTHETRYLVVGDQPLDRAALTEFGELKNTADQLGIETVALPRFLDLLGYKAEVSTTNLGRRRPTKEQPAAAEEFRQRRPPAEAESAF
jgi:hypothetical protein